MATRICNRIFFIFLIAICTSECLIAQTTLSAVKTGTEVPDIVLKNFLDNPSKTTSLKELSKNKIVIIDFWATWCGGCLTLAPHLDDLQKKFEKDLQIIAVTDEKKEFVRKFFAAHPEYNNWSFPVLTDDKDLMILFPHRLLPHDVIINKKGVYVIATDPQQLTDNSIKEMIDGEIPGVHNKIDNMKFDINKPLLVDTNGGLSGNFVGRTLLTNYIPGLATYAHIDREGDSVSRIVFTNSTIAHMYTAAYSQFNFAVPNHKRMHVMLKDTTPYFVPPIGPGRYEWAIKNAYCYELILPRPTKLETAFGYMMDDLNRYFDITGKVKVELTDCWVLVRTNKDDSLLQSKGGALQVPSTGQMTNLPLIRLVDYLNTYRDIEPVVDESGINYNVDMNTRFVKTYKQNIYPDIDEINKQLGVYGLKLIRAQRSLPILYLSDK